jgi:hypothetical protein
VAATFVRNGPQGSNKVTGTGLTLAASGFVIPAGDTLVVAIADDSSVGSGSTVNDPRNNTYTLIGAKLATGCSASIYVSKLTTQLAATDALTITFSSTTGAMHTGISWHFSGLNTTLDDIVQTGNNNTTTPDTGLPTPSPTHAGSVVFGVVAYNGPTGDVTNADTTTTNGTWASLLKLGTTGGAAASNETIFGQYKIITAGGAQSYKPTLGTARNWCEVLLTLNAITPAVLSPHPTFIRTPISSVR